MKTRVPRFYFSFRSPYAWMASRLLESRFPAAHQELEFTPFWDPDATTLELLHARGGDMLYAPMSKAKHLYILHDVRRLVRKLGYSMTWPVDIDPRWDLPHLSYLKARRLGEGPAFFRAVLGARWERGAVIYREDTIRDIAQEIGLDAETLLAAPTEADITAEGVDGLLRAYEDGVFGVPFFIVGREKFWGVDRFEDFAAAFSVQAPRSEGRELAAAVLANIGGYDTDCAGGCG